MVQIIVDSAADLEQEAALAHGITVLPLTITFPDGEYTDGVSLSRRAFYEKLAASKEVPHTSQVSPRAFEAAFKRVSEAGDTAVVITMSGKLSGTLQSAHMAADAFGETVCIVDSENARRRTAAGSKRSTSCSSPETGSVPPHRSTPTRPSDRCSGASNCAARKQGPNGGRSRRATPPSSSRA